MTAAIILIPADHPWGSTLVRQCLDHCERRGYRLHGIYREWPEAIQALDEGRATVVVMCPASITPGRRLRLVAQKANGAARNVSPANRVVTRRLVMDEDVVSLSADQVRLLIDDGAGTIPIGLDPETIAAARRIARHLAACRGPLNPDRH